MTRKSNSPNRETDSNRAFAKWFCTQVEAGWLAATGKSVVNRSAIARGLENNVTAKKYIAWQQGAAGLPQDLYHRVAKSAIEKGWFDSSTFFTSSSLSHISLTDSSAVREALLDQKREIQSFQKAKLSLLQKLANFQSSWKSLKFHVPSRIDSFHLDSLNSSVDRLSVTQKFELARLNERIAAPQPDLLKHLEEIQSQVEQLRLILSKPKDMPDHGAVKTSSMLGKNDPTLVPGVTRDDLVFDAFPTDDDIYDKDIFKDLVAMSLDRSFRILREYVEEKK